MLKRLFQMALALIAFILPLQSQSDFEYAISRHKGNKIILLDEWKAEDTGKWRHIIDSEGIYEHGFTLLDRVDLATSGVISHFPWVRNTGAIETWLRQRYGLIASAKWVVLNLENKLIISGVQTPSAKEFEQMLDQRGIRSPSRQLRDFLRENPDHLDAMTDLLKEVRRRSLHVMPPNTTEDLDTETDLRTWGVFAAETDKVFKSNWLGVELGFFRPDQIPPERFSKLMKNVFRKHISKVESAIQLEPANNTLWNIWAWMARSTPDYKWDTFIKLFEPAIFSNNLNYGNPSVSTISSGEVSVWILEEARANNDWNTIIKFAKVAKLGGCYPGETKGEWSPVGGFRMVDIGELIEGYPAKSAYAPHLEALLMLGDIDGDNDVFDDMIRRLGAGNAAIAAEVAKSVGNENLAKVWEKGELVNKAPYATIERNTFPITFLLLSDDDDDNWFDSYQKKLSLAVGRLNVSHFYQNILQPHYPSTLDNLNTLGWKKDDGDRWAMVANDGRVLIQDSAMPDPENLQIILNRLNIKSILELYQEYIAEYGNYPGLELSIAFEIFNKIAFKHMYSPYDDQSEIALSQVAVHLNNLLRYYPDILVSLPQAIGDIGDAVISIQSASMKSLSKTMLTNIELLLERKPSSENLWNQWLTWKNIEGDRHSVESIVDRVKLSPLSQAGTVPPHFVISTYYKECIKNGNWPKVIKLLKTAWDRDFLRIKADPSRGYYIGDKLGIHLIEAYLHYNSPSEADEIFNVVLGFGGKFADISKIVKLAKEKGHERLAREWEGKVKK